MKKRFDLDTRNTGGLKQLADNMYFHHKALMDVKPSLKIKPPKNHVSKKQTQDSSKPIAVDLPMYKNKNEFTNVFRTFETVMTMKKGGIDSSAPLTMNFRRNLTGNVSKAQKHQNNEHLLNLKSQYQRMNSANNMTERKKNPNDPTVNPARFFRREGESMQNMRIDKLMEHMTKQHRKIENNSTQSEQFVQKVMNNEQNRIQQINSQKNKNSSKRANSAKPEKKEIQAIVEITEFVDQVPKVKGNDPSDYLQLKKELVGTIFKYRVYKTDDLESLFGRILVYNPQLDLEKAEQLFQDIRDEFQQ